MLGVVEAFDGLSGIASRGRVFYHGEVYYPAATQDDPRMSQSVGTGYDFTRAVSLPDATEGLTVEGAIAFRMIRMSEGRGGEPTLFLRTRLEWTSSYGDHTSYACYEFPAAAAARLADKASPEEEPSEDELDQMDVSELLDLLGEALGAALDESEVYGASWQQVYPDAPSDEAFAAVIEYHGKAVRAAREAEPLLLCMLSDTDMGEVAKEELDNLLEWVQTQPEAA